jgi:hypothetical protein
VRTLADADADALGDLAGLIRRLGDVAELGANAMRPAHRSEIGTVRSMGAQAQGDDRAPGPEQVLAVPTPVTTACACCCAATRWCQSEEVRPDKLAPPGTNVRARRPGPS